MEESRREGRGGHGLDGGRGSCRIAPRGLHQLFVVRRRGPWPPPRAGVLLAAEGPQPSHAAKLDRRLKIVKYGSQSKGGS